LCYCNNNIGCVCGDAKENKDLQKAAEVEWESIYCELQRLLRYGVTHASLPPGAAADKYFISGNRRQPHRRSGLATLPCVGAVP